MTGRETVLGLAGGVGICFLAAGLAAAGSAGAGDFYVRLSRPSWAPPGWLFAPMWTMLYLLMGLAAGRVWNARRRADARFPLALFAVQLGLNVLWTWVFFAWHLGAAALVIVVLLWVLIAASAVAFWRRDRLAGWLLLPYLAWVSLACALTHSVWQRNPQLLG